MGYALRLEENFVDLRCGKCGIVFWVPTGWQIEKRETGDGWSCPNGHPRVYKQSEADRLRELLEAANRRNTELAGQVGAAREARDKAEKAKARLEKRVRAGVCPCCSRTFQNLARHMATKHPEKTAA